MSNKQDYICQIADTIKNYRKGELNYSLDEEHVERWMSQFDADEQEIVVQETYNLIAQGYFKKKAIKRFLGEVISSNDLWQNKDIANEIGNTQFLSIQNKGSIQRVLLDLLNNLVLETFGMPISTIQGRNTNRYLYLDDCLFSGNTLRRDLERWMPDAEDGSKLDIVFLTVHSAGNYYVANKVLNNLCAQKGIEYHIWCDRKINNFAGDWYNYDCLWPKAVDDPNVNMFVENLHAHAAENGWPIRLFREREYQSPLFTDYESREIFEKAMLKAGAYIYSCSNSNNFSMKPMGYDYFNSLGFGSFFATYNNISNNSPLAFWWGDPNMPKMHPFGKWYPLLPRKVNDNEFFE